MEPYQQLEVEFGKWLNLPAEKMVACSSGTAALHLAMEGLELRPGGQVVVPEFTMVACARAVTMAGLRPVFVDCKMRDLQMDMTKLHYAINSLTQAIMLVHIYGRQCDTQYVHRNNSHELPVIEDLAESPGILPHSKSDAACWSFYKNKIIAGDEGGMVYFRCPAAAHRAREMRSHGFNTTHDFFHSPRGTNYRLSNTHAQLILNSLAKVDENIAARRNVIEWYDKHVSTEYHMPSRRVPWVYDLRLTDGRSVIQLVQDLNDQGIAARHAFKPMSYQPEYIGHYHHLTAYIESQRVAYLPVDPAMVEADVERIATLANL